MRFTIKENPERVEITALKVSVFRVFWSLFSRVGTEYGDLL